MNILFYTSFRVSATMGGTERATISVASGLIKYYGCHCFSLYGVDSKTPKEQCFEDELMWSIKDGEYKLSTYIREHDIDWIINQGAFGLTNAFKKSSEGTKCKVAFVHHYEPGGEELLGRLNGLLYDLKNANNIYTCLKYGIKILLYPFLRYRSIRRLPLLYRMTYQQADRVVLLCKGAIHQYKEYAKIDNIDKFRVIPNALSYNESLPQNGIKNKKHIVLIVSRLVDVPKRISLALKIWNEVKKRPEAAGWQLNIVGHGRDEAMYHKMVEQQQIPDVNILGRQQPKPYYEEAAIFMMTSKSEGWGLTLTEAQQFGVVPIAFDSYDALYDIITDGKDGIIIKEGYFDVYIDELAKLMADVSRRQQMASNAIHNCSRFSQEKIANRWWQLLNEK